MSGTDRAFWMEVRRGLLLVVRAIEYHHNLPHNSQFTIGAAPTEAPPPAESPQTASARSSGERVG